MTGSSAARLMLLSRMKNRMRFVKMLWLTILWHITLNLQKKKKAIETKMRKNEVICGPCYSVVKLASRERGQN